MGVATADEPKRHDRRIVIHFDYDCFYAAVVEHENPSLKSLPLAVQQKQIIVTCNYEARSRGLYKLQTVREAREKCPDVIIELGEDLTRFRNASKDNYNFLRGYVWSNRVERLGFDEVFMDVTDMIDYNVDLLNRNDLSSSFFCLDKNDPTIGFRYDANSIFGHTFPAKVAFSSEEVADSRDPDDLVLRLRLGSHLAQHLRHQLEEQTGYTATVGISTNKLLSKLVGNVNKPKRQTTLFPPYTTTTHGLSHVHQFIDEHDIGKIPYIGFKIAQKIRQYVLGRPAAFDSGLVYGGSKENVKVRNVRLLGEMDVTLLEGILHAPGVPKDLPAKVWGLINGVDDSEVAKSREVPQQISIEDSYIRLDELFQVRRELKMLSSSLIKRMRVDLTTQIEDEILEHPEVEEDPEHEAHSPTNTVETSAKWIAHPGILRLSTRPRPPLKPDGTRSRTFARISKSCPLPSFVFQLQPSIESLSERLAEETIMPLFAKLHPEKRGWDLSLVNLCVTKMTLTGREDRQGAGRDIGRMFKRQDEVLKEWKVEDRDVPPDVPVSDVHEYPHERETDQDLQDQRQASEDLIDDGDDYHLVTAESLSTPDEIDSSASEMDWESEDETSQKGDICSVCGAILPAFAMVAHKQFHDLPNT